MEVLRGARFMLCDLRPELVASRDKEGEWTPRCVYRHKGLPTYTEIQAHLGLRSFMEAGDFWNEALERMKRRA